MNNVARSRRMRQMMYKEINEQCARFELESGDVIIHQETEEEKTARLKKIECELKRKSRWTLHS